MQFWGLGNLYEHNIQFERFVEICKQAIIINTVTDIPDVGNSNPVTQADTYRQRLAKGWRSDF